MALGEFILNCIGMETYDRLYETSSVPHGGPVARHDEIRQESNNQVDRVRVEILVLSKEEFEKYEQDYPRLNGPRKTISEYAWNPNYPDYPAVSPLAYDECVDKLKKQARLECCNVVEIIERKGIKTPSGVISFGLTANLYVNYSVLSQEAK